MSFSFRSLHRAGALLALVLVGCGGGDADPAADGSLVGAAGGTVAGPAGSSLVVPAGALAAEARIGIAQTTAGAPPLPAGLAAHGAMFAFTPHGTAFAEPVTVTLPFDLASVPAGSSPRLYKTNARDEWEHVPTAAFRTDSVSARIEGFSHAQVVIPPLEPNPPRREWSFGVLPSRNALEQEVDSGAQTGGALKQLFDFGPATVTRDVLLVDGLLTRGDGRAIGDVGGSADGVTYWVGTASRPGGTITRLTQTQTFLKSSDDASYSFTVSAVQLDAADGNAVIGRSCRPEFAVDAGNCDVVGAEVLLGVHAFVRGPSSLRVFFRGDGFADLRGGAVVNPDTGTRVQWKGSAKAIDGTVALWGERNFDQVREPFNGPDGKISMRLKKPRTFHIDLSSVKVGEIFTVRSSAYAIAYDHGRQAVDGPGAEFPLGATAYLRDPSSIGGTTSTTRGLTAIAAQTVAEVPAAGVQPPEPCVAGPDPDPAAGTLQFGAATYAVFEGSVRPIVEVTRVGGTRGTVTATVASGDGTAVAGTDYRAVARTVAFADGDETPRLVPVATIQNTLGGQPPRTVALTLSQPGGCAALGAPGTTVLTIRDDDPAPPATPGGGLDASFGSGGKTTASFGGGDSAMAVQADGRIVMAGGSTDAFVLARFNADGSVDTGFGNAGQVRTDVVVGGVVEEVARAVAIQADGKIVVAGHVRTPGGPFTVVLARYRADGSPDAGFGTAGLATGPVGARAFAVAVQADGRIVVAGDDTDRGDFLVARFDANGTLDTGFGTGGRVTTDIAGGPDTARNLVLQPNGAIVVSGDPFGNNPGTGVARFTPGGGLDPSFGSGGKVALAGAAVGQGLALQADGRLVLVGQAGNDSTSRFATVRLNADGSVDTGFGTAGTVTTDFSAGRGDAALAVAVQGDGRIVVAGRSALQANSNVAAVRLLPDGAIDPSFGEAGKLVIDFFRFSDAAENVAIQADGKILFGGFASGLTGRGYAFARVLR